MDRVPLKKMGQKMKKKNIIFKKKKLKNIIKKWLKKYVKMPQNSFSSNIPWSLNPQPPPYSIPFNNSDREDIEVSLTLK